VRAAGRPSSMVGAYIRFVVLSLNLLWMFSDRKLRQMAVVLAILLSRHLPTSTSLASLFFSSFIFRQEFHFALDKAFKMNIIA
jgi:hypothetical protein